MQQCKECVCVREGVCVCVCEREREREKEKKERMITLQQFLLYPFIPLRSCSTIWQLIISKQTKKYYVTPLPVYFHS